MLFEIALFESILWCLWKVTLYWGIALFYLQDRIFWDQKVNRTIVNSRCLSPRYLRTYCIYLIYSLIFWKFVPSALNIIKFFLNKNGYSIRRGIPIPLLEIRYFKSVYKWQIIILIEGIQVKNRTIDKESKFKLGMHYNNDTNQQPNRWNRRWFQLLIR